ncbi:MAG: hypothetical protein IJ968_07535, partial [Clostridia bacterium]|nr:hypothetical protein [Clostridia bacterium]
LGVLVLPDQQVKLIPELTVVLSSFLCIVFKVRCPLFPALWDRSAARLIIISPSFLIVNTFFQNFFTFFQSFFLSPRCCGIW